MPLPSSSLPSQSSETKRPERFAMRYEPTGRNSVVAKSLLAVVVSFSDMQGNWSSLPPSEWTACTLLYLGPVGWFGVSEHDIFVSLRRLWVKRRRQARHKTRERVCGQTLELQRNEDQTDPES